jgi:histidinol-phosphatase (PHP family)
LNFSCDLHCHSVYSDGKHTPEEMIQRAVNLGLKSIGISDHAYAPYDLDACTPAEKMQSYRRELFALKEQYGEIISVYAGLEVDAFHLYDKKNWDYVIGSVHYVKGRKGYYTVDYTLQQFQQAVEDLGSIRAVAEAYGQAVIGLAVEYRPHILGHLDIVTRLVRKGMVPLDTNASWYREMWLEITRQIAGSGCIVEVNTSAIYRGQSPEPYPSVEILKMLRERKVPVILSSDAHQKENLTKAFEQGCELLQGVGYHSRKELGPQGFVDVPL